jgi:hypothetical protein
MPELGQEIGRPMIVNGRTVKKWYWKVARSMRTHGSHMVSAISVTSVKDRLRRFQACQHIRRRPGWPARR